jgi:polysaccharide export outer membrane protein
MDCRTHNQSKCKRLVGLLAMLVVMHAAGCATYHDLSDFQFQQQDTVNPKPYRLEPPDVIQISSAVVREISNYSVTISPDGTVMLPLLGTVHVSGKTTEQVATLLRNKAQEFYDEADVSVNVTRFRSKFVYVFGEVALAGQFPYTGSNHVLELLAAAQPTRAADRERIQILRPTGDGDAVRMTVKLSELVTKGNTDRNAILEDGDIVFVPANGFAEVGYMIQNLLRPVAPAAATVQGANSIDTGQAALRSSGGTP